MDLVVWLFNCCYRGGQFFVKSFDLFFSGGHLKFIPALLLIFAVFGSITAILGLIGNGISSANRSMNSSNKK